jgi:uncharacterized protein YecE (DUF72 family)
MTEPATLPAPEAKAHPVLVGTAGWADADLVASGWYPTHVRTAADRLACYAQRFPLVEVDTTYYAIPTASTVSTWARVPSPLTMDVKAYRLFTGQPTPVASLPPDLRDLAAGRTTLRTQDAPAALLQAAWERFHAALEPLQEAGHLGLVLLQFPATVVADESGRGLVARALELCRPLRAAVEWRHGSWLAPDKREASLKLLAEHQAAYVCVDMPQNVPAAMPPLLLSTTDVAVIRLHGHSLAWRYGDKRDRYRYEYSPAELDAWAQSARQLARQADRVHIIVNTCCAGAAQRAAETLRDRLD